MRIERPKLMSKRPDVETAKPPRSFDELLQDVAPGLASETAIRELVAQGVIKIVDGGKRLELVNLHRELTLTEGQRKRIEALPGKIGEILKGTSTATNVNHG